TKPQTSAAFTDLMNRALQNPTEPVELRGGFQVDAIAQKLTEARERLFKRQQEQLKLESVVVVAVPPQPPHDKDREPEMASEANKSEMLASEEPRPATVQPNGNGNGNAPEKNVEVRTWRRSNPDPRSREWG